MSEQSSTLKPGLAQQESVYAHVERTVHALLEAIAAALPDAVSPTAEEGTVTPEGIKILAEAVQALSSVAYPTETSP